MSFITRDSVIHLATSCSLKVPLAPIKRIQCVMQVHAFDLMTAYDAVDKQRTAAFWKGAAVDIFTILPTALLRQILSDLILSTIFSDKTSFSLAERRILRIGTGICVRLALYPLDVVKTRLMADLGTFSKDFVYTNPLQCGVETYLDDGVAGLYKGLDVALLSEIPYQAVAVLSNDVIKHFLRDKQPSRLLTLGIHAVSSQIAQAVTYPLSTIQRRMQSTGKINPNNHDYEDSLTCAKRTFQEEGLRGLYNGCLLNLVDIPASFLHYFLYVGIKNKFAN
eukprot:CAMPEP_0174251980 /NCGR_PEP_ID=MMETSP0439-20130205/1640_1 /TAXON_ID=0 /ORGANISM="Stereomyxa ramosa, Strain Chinc5" /LENGTH=278 /DNA_ID=CAMNT_0015332443 /DNA_START=23 /DNA_END=859 /DNA_ORIENTATION=+